MNPFTLDKMRKVIDNWYLGNRTEAAQIVRTFNKVNTVKLIVNPHQANSNVVCLSKEQRIDFEDFVIEALNRRI